MFGGRKFQFRPVLTVFALIAAAILVSLGVWQVHRLQWKTGLIAQVEARTHAAPIPFDEAVRRAEAGEYMEYAPVTLSGRAHPQTEARVFGSYDGVAGVYVFEPLETPSGGTVYVNHGFAPQGAAYDLSANGAEEIVGLFRYAENLYPPASWLAPKGKSADGLWFQRKPQEFAADAGLSASPFYVDEAARPDRALPKGGTTRLEFRNSHLDYALTWFGLAAALVAIWFASSLKSTQE